jgi:hypothetical protein
MIVTKLSNGLRVANFSSPHHFEFTDGSVLPRILPDYSQKLKVTFIEDKVSDSDPFTYTLRFELSEFLIDQINKAYKEWDKGLVDYVLCPLPMIQAMKEYLAHPELTHDLIVEDLLDSPFRCIRMEDRVEKKCSIDKFTI